MQTFGRTHRSDQAILEALLRRYPVIAGETEEQPCDTPTEISASVTVPRIIDLDEWVISPIETSDREEIKGDQPGRLPGH